MVILGGTSFTIGENIVTIEETTSYNLSDYISEEGADYYVFINAEGRVVANTIRTPAEGYMFIGQFHTLCVDCNENMTGLISVGNIQKLVGDYFDIMNYFKYQDVDFANFYHKKIVAMNNGSPYNVATIDHPLSDFKARDILPESVWCLNFHPKCKNWDGMVYCNASEICVDIYHNSGSGDELVSEYGSVHTNDVIWLNATHNLNLVGKRNLFWKEFINVASGSNELTKIQGSVDQSTVGGHVDTAGRRMISFIGCEECCGYLTAFQTEACTGVEYGYPVNDGRGLFGANYDTPRYIDFGGAFDSPIDRCGSRGNDGNPIYANLNDLSVRGCCNVSIV